MGHIQERCRGLTLLPVTTNASREQAEFNETVVLLALAAKPKAQSVASQSTSALYETSLLNFRIPIENRKWTVPERIIDAEATISPSSHSDAKLNSTKNANDTIIQLLHDMKKTFEVINCTLMPISSLFVAFFCTYVYEILYNMLYSFLFE